MAKKIGASKKVKKSFVGGKLHHKIEPISATVDADGNIILSSQEASGKVKAVRHGFTGIIGHKGVGKTTLSMATATGLEVLKMAAFDWNDDARGIQLVDAIREGIGYGDFEKIAAPMQFDTVAWARVLGTTTRTLERYKKEDKVFKAQQSERIIEIKQLYHKGMEVFNDKESFHIWLHTENIPLGKVTPLSLLDTNLGISMVKDELGRIEHGLFA
ncbi:type II RES/Xre toxin-antitoxin system antitoxin [Flagellimonas hymeniacidonis]|nr:antitoxin Xre/MbcA/ParS toxin-binding domain-containing protein [Flagellimonas hymeniacidonis]